MKLRCTHGGAGGVKTGQEEQGNSPLSHLVRASSTLPSMLPRPKTATFFSGASPSSAPTLQSFSRCRHVARSGCKKQTVSQQGSHAPPTDRFVPALRNLKHGPPLAPRATPSVALPLAPPRENLLKQLLLGYDAALRSNPITTKAMTSLVGFLMGDFIAQGISTPGFEAARWLRLGLYGLLIDGPIGHLWYQALDSRVFPEAPTSTKAVLTKTAADQLLWAPVMTVVFFAFLRTLEGHPELILPTVQDKLVRTIAANYLIWPLAHFVNFKLVPSEYRILFNNIVAVAWTAFLSWSCSGAADGLLAGAGAAAGDVAMQPEDWLAALPCAHKLPHAAAAAAGLGTLQEVRQALAVEHVLAAWGLQGFGSADTSARLFGLYEETRQHIMMQVCSVPIAPPKL